jgi:hypothetical protein
VLVEPLKSLRTGRPSIGRKVLVAWLLAFLFATPQLAIFVETSDEVYVATETGGWARRTVHACRSRGYTAEWQRKVYFSFMTGYILVIPTAIMSFCYLNIIKAVWTRARDTSVYGPKLHFVSTRRSRYKYLYNNRFQTVDEY